MRNCFRLQKQYYLGTHLTILRQNLTRVPVLSLDLFAVSTEQTVQASLVGWERRASPPPAVTPTVNANYAEGARSPCCSPWQCCAL